MNKLPTIPRRKAPSVRKSAVVNVNIRSKAKSAVNPKMVKPKAKSTSKKEPVVSKSLVRGFVFINV